MGFGSSEVPMYPDNCEHGNMLPKDCPICLRAKLVERKHQILKLSLELSTAQERVKRLEGDNYSLNLRIELMAKSVKKLEE